MTLRIPINNFGTPIYSSTEGGLSKIAADRAYINVDGGDQMKGNLEMSGYKISNLKTPVENQDATNKLYVDELYLSLTEKIDELKQAANQIRSLTQNFATKNELIGKIDEVKSSTQNFATKNELIRKTEEIKSLTQNFATKNELIRKIDEVKSSTQNFITKNELIVHKFFY